MIVLSALPWTALAQTRGQEHQALRERLTAAAAPLAKMARVSLQVESLDDGDTVLAQGGEELLNIASNTKLFTAAAALATLGPDYTFTTELFADGLARGKATTLYVRGKGDPSLTTERLYGIAAELWHAGLREVTGDLVLDETWFDATRTPRGFAQGDADHAYLSPTGALSLNANAIALVILPAKGGAKPAVQLDPASDYATVDTSRLTGRCAAPDLQVSSTPQGEGGERQKLTVRGCLVDPAAGARVLKKIDHPAFYFGHTFKRVLAQRGIRIKGTVRLGESPKGAVPLHVVESEPLADVLKVVNKRSLNFAAEMLLKAMAAQQRGTPATFAAGLDVVADYLAREVGLPRGSYVMENGSGLNDFNRFSAAQVNRVLRHMEKDLALSPDYLASLGIAGVDGTLRNRLTRTDAEGNLRGKTGTLGTVASLSGYVQAASGERFVFSFIANDFTAKVAEVRRALDVVGATIAQFGKAPRAAPEPGPEDPALLLSAQKVRSYTATAQGKGFLRAALATESDPAVRLALANALWLQAPTEHAHLRALLAALQLDSRSAARVQSVFRTLERPVPGLEAAAALALGGNAEAIARLVALSPAFEGDEHAEPQLARGLARIADGAPHDLLYSLSAATVEERLSASRLLLRQATGGDERHPLWAMLRSGRASPSSAFAVLTRLLQRGTPISSPAEAGLLAADPSIRKEESAEALADSPVAPYGG